MTCKAHIILLALLTILIGSSCRREENLSPNGNISFTFYTEGAMTRAVGNGNPADGGGIAVLNNDNPDIVIALANNNGTIVAWYPNKVGDLYTSSLSSSSSTSATISFEDSARGTYSVYAIANASWLGTTDTNPTLSSAINAATTVSELEALVLERSALLSFNNEHSMPLSAKGTVTTNSRGTGQVNLELKRIVARVGLSFSNKTEERLTLYDCSVTLHIMNPIKGYLFSRDNDYYTRGELDNDDLVLCNGSDIVIEASSSYDLQPQLVFPSVAPTQSEGGHIYLCDIIFTIRTPKDDVDYDEDNQNTYTVHTYTNTSLPVQDLTTYENILVLSRNQDLTILTEINKRDQDQDISFNFSISGWVNRTEGIEFN